MKRACLKNACLLLLPAMLLFATAMSGCSDEISEPIFSRVSVTPACGVVPLNVEAFAAVSGGDESGDPLGGTNGLEVSWDFGDTGTGATSIAFHQYTEPGEYTVKVKATDPGGKTADSEVTVTVMADSLVVAANSDFPGGNVIAALDSIQFGLSAAACDINYPAVPGDAVKMIFRWEMEVAGVDTFIFDGPTPEFAYPKGGDFDVNLAVTYPAQAVTRHTTLQFAVLNPVAELTAQFPGNNLEGNGEFTLTLTGTGFVDGSVVRWNGEDRETAFVSFTEITALIPATDIETAGFADVTVSNPTPGGGISDPIEFTILLVP